MRVFFCLLMLMLLCPCAGLAQESALTAREAFGALPTSIFENTAEGLRTRTNSSCWKKARASSGNWPARAGT